MQKGPKTGGYICDNMRLIQLKISNMTKECHKKGFFGSIYKRKRGLEYFGRRKYMQIIGHVINYSWILIRGHVTNKYSWILIRGLKWEYANYINMPR